MNYAVFKMSKTRPPQMRQDTHMSFREIHGSVEAIKDQLIEVQSYVCSNGEHSQKWAKDIRFLTAVP